MKKVLSLVLVLAMVLSSFGFAFAASDDITGHENEAAIRRLVTLGLVKGDAQGYRPNDTITRAEFAAMAVRVLGKETVAEISKGATVFNDVPASHWASGYVKVASTLGLVNGYGDGNFGPADQITYEQALAIIVRALGYEPAASDKGGYPMGYLVVADDLGLTDLADGVAGMPASRGLVFQVIDNALTVDMMVQVGYGDEAKYEVKEDKTLLTGLGYEKVTDRVVAYDADDSEITLDDEGKVEVAEGFDFEAVYGLEIAAWLDGDELVVYEAKDEPKFDATTGGSEIKLVEENKKYDVAKGATLILDGDDDVTAANFTADYAKIVLNDEDEIVWAQGFTWDDTFVVQEVEDEVINSYDGDELDSEDYILVEAGREISVEDLEEGDILFFNKDQGYAVVYNVSETGEIERVYDDSFKFEGTVYDYNLANYDMKYLDGTDLGNADKDVLAAMMDEEVEVTVYFDYAGDVVLVTGDQGNPDESSFYAVVESNSVAYDTRGTLKFTFDVLNQDGEVVDYDLSAKFVDKYDGTEDRTGSETPATLGTAFDTWMNDMVAKTVVKVTVDEDGAITKVAKMGSRAQVDAELKIDATYAEGYKLQETTVVFWDEDNDDAVADWTVMTWAEAADEFNKILANGAYVYPGSNGRADVLVVTKTDADSDTTNYTGLVTNVRELKSGDTWEITIEVNGEEFVYLTDGDLDETKITGISDMDDLEDKIVTVTVGDDTLEVSAAVVEVGTTPGLVTDIDTSDDEITVANSVYYELVEDAVIYDATDSYATLSLRDLDVNDKVSVYFANSETTRFVQYVIRTDLAPANGGPAVEGDATIYSAYAHGTATITLEVDGKVKVYNVVNTSVIENADGTPFTSGTIAVDTPINFVLVEGTNDIGYIKILQ